MLYQSFPFSITPLHLYPLPNDQFTLASDAPAAANAMPVLCGGASAVWKHPLWIILIWFGVVEVRDNRTDNTMTEPIGESESWQTKTTMPAVTEMDRWCSRVNSLPWHTHTNCCCWHPSSFSSNLCNLSCQHSALDYVPVLSDTIRCTVKLSPSILIGDQLRTLPFR